MCCCFTSRSIWMEPATSPCFAEMTNYRIYILYLNTKSTYKLSAAWIGLPLIIWMRYPFVLNGPVYCSNSSFNRLRIFFRLINHYDCLCWDIFFKLNSLPVWSLIFLPACIECIRERNTREPMRRIRQERRSKMFPLYAWTCTRPFSVPLK